MSEIFLVHMPCSLNGDWASKGEDMTSCVNLDTKVETYAKLQQRVLMIDVVHFIEKG